MKCEKAWYPLGHVIRISGFSENIKQNYEGFLIECDNHG